MNKLLFKNVMSTKRLVARNIVFNWAGRAAEAIVGFLIAPFLVDRLGDTNYGLWTVIASLTAYFGFLDVGVRTSVGRDIAFHRAKNEREGINATLNTAALLLSGVGVLALLGMLGMQAVFFSLFDVPPEEVGSARLALLLVGLNLGLSFPLTLFDATLWAFQRFDILAIIEVVVAGCRAALIYCLIGSGQGVVTLALITLATTVAGGLAKGWMSFREEGALQLGWQHFNRKIIPSLYGYGFWRMLMAVGNLGSTRINPSIIGACLSIALVTPYSLATRLISYTSEVFMSVRSAMTPAATTFFAQERPQWQRRFMIDGGKCCLALTLFFLTLFLFLGRPLLELWIGPRLVYASQLLTVLVLGECLPLSQTASTSMLLAMARHKVLACLSVVEILLAIVLALAVVRPYGLMGVCVVQAATSGLCRGILPLVYACRLIRLPIGRYLIDVFLPPIVVAAIPALLLGALVVWHSPQSWPELMIYGLAYGMCYGIACAFLVGYERVKLRAAEFLKSVLKTQQVTENPSPERRNDPAQAQASCSFRDGGV